MSIDYDLRDICIKHNIDLEDHAGLINDLRFYVTCRWLFEEPIGEPIKSPLIGSMVCFGEPSGWGPFEKNLGTNTYLCTGVYETGTGVRFRLYSVDSGREFYSSLDAMFDYKSGAPVKIPLARINVAVLIACRKVKKALNVLVFWRR